MRMARVIVVLLAATALALGQQGATEAEGRPAAGNVLASSPVIEISGTIKEVGIRAGQGMPYLDVEHDKNTTRVMLGSMRYLIEQNFKPKAGDKVTLRGYQLNDQVAAIEITLVDARSTLRLRDADGRPLWRQGRHGRGARRQ